MALAKAMIWPRLSHMLLFRSAAAPRRRCLVANRATLPQKWPPPPLPNVADSFEPDAPPPQQDDADKLRQGVAEGWSEGAVLSGERMPTVTDLVDPAPHSSSSFKTSNLSKSDQLLTTHRLPLTGKRDPLHTS